MKENSTEEIKQMAQEKAQQAKTAAKEKLDQVKNMSADEAKELAKEKAEQAKKLAAEKLEQMKKLSADDAKKMAEEKIANLKKMPMINKISYGAAAAVILGLVVTLSGSGSANMSPNGEWELFAYNGECGEGDLLEKSDQKKRELKCKIGDIENTILTQDLYADGSVRYEQGYDLLVSETYTDISPVFEKRYNAKGEITQMTAYVNKFNNSDQVQRLTTEEYEKYDNGKIRNKTTYAVKQKDDGNWVALKEQYYRGFSNGKPEKEIAYEIKQNKDGTWDSLGKSQVVFNDAGQKTYEETYAMQQNNKGEWYSAPVKIYSGVSNPVITDLVLKEDINGYIKSYAVAKKSVDWNASKPDGVMETYEVVQHADGKWESFVKNATTISNATTRHKENVIKKNSKTGRYSALATLSGSYKMSGGKKVQFSNTTYKVVENDSGRWVSLPVKEERYSNKGVLTYETTYVVQKNAAGDNGKYEVLSKSYSRDGELTKILTSETKQNADGKWVSLLTKKERYDKGSLLVEDTYVIRKSTRGDHKSFKVSSKEYNGNSLRSSSTSEIKQNDDGTWRSLLVDMTTYAYDRKQKRYTATVKSQTKFELYKDDRGDWQRRRIKNS